MGCLWNFHGIQPVGVSTLFDLSMSTGNGEAFKVEWVAFVSSFIPTVTNGTKLEQMLNCQPNEKSSKIFKNSSTRSCNILTNGILTDPFRNERKIMNTQKIWNFRGISHRKTLGVSVKVAPSISHPTLQKHELKHWLATSSNICHCLPLVALIPLWLRTLTVTSRSSWILPPHCVLKWRHRRKSKGVGLLTEIFYGNRLENPISKSQKTT